MAPGRSLCPCGRSCCCCCCCYCCCCCCCCCCHCCCCCCCRCCCCCCCCCCYSCCCHCWCCRCFSFLFFSFSQRKIINGSDQRPDTLCHCFLSCAEGSTPRQRRTVV
ncbi:unnamed protein product [Polarella glacialis]|uniref:Secreted protein n=1 Tax=Polarella glacialis TaxID=89957 RepID=A0A813JER8_POLGL|nr:unnamed protein product [Polarella glacialis]